MPTAIDRSDVSSWRPADAMAPQEDAALFPVLSTRLLQAVSAHASCRQFAAGEMVFEQGTRNAPFLVVEHGRVVFFDRNRCDREHEYFAQTTPGMFIGDLSIFTGQPTLAEARAAELTRVMQLTHEQLRTLIRENSEAGDLILRTFLARRTWLEGAGHGQMHLLGPHSCPGTYALRNFLGRNQVPFQWRDTQTDPLALTLVEHFSIRPSDYPVLISQGQVHRNPQLRQVARCLGLLPNVRASVYDLAVVGAGPGGLAAAVYGASEGLDTVVLDSAAPGGQAGTSSKIENYLGFMTGVSGEELARQAVLQARKFGATLCNPVGVTQIDCQGKFKELTLDDGQVVRARAVVLAMGARYRRLTADGCDRYDGVGVYYSAGHLEAVHCKKQAVVVVGGGNSAGQAAVFLSQHAQHVYLVVRRDSLAATMSKYLIDRISSLENIELVPESEVACLRGDGSLQEVELRCPQGLRTLPCAALFVMVGAEPSTAWLAGCCALDDRGFVLTGADAAQHPSFREHWRLHGQAPQRQPLYLETTRPGVFAVGDVRAGSVKRVATSVGEGAMAIAFVHQLLATM